MSPGWAEPRVNPWHNGQQAGSPGHLFGTFRYLMSWVLSLLMSYSALMRSTTLSISLQMPCPHSSSGQLLLTEGKLRQNPQLSQHHWDAPQQCTPHIHQLHPRTTAAQGQVGRHKSLCVSPSFPPCFLRSGDFPADEHITTSFGNASEVLTFQAPARKR